MKDINSHVNNVTCDQADLLLAYLYGEASESEAAEFTLHLRDCDHCRAEAATLGTVSQQLGEWRDTTLPRAWHAATSDGSFAARLNDAFTVNRQPLPSVIASTARANDTRSVRAAFAALRDFFALSPAWMRGATAFATVAVVALLAFAASGVEANWDENGLAFRVGRERVVTNNVASNSNIAAPTGYTETQIEQLVSARIAVERASWEAQNRPVTPQSGDQIATPTAKRPTTPQTMLAKANDSGNSSPQQRALRGNTRTSSALRNRELASNATDEPPRLYDLIDVVD